MVIAIDRFHHTQWPRRGSWHVSPLLGKWAIHMGRQTSCSQALSGVEWYLHGNEAVEGPVKQLLSAQVVQLTPPDTC